MGTVTFRGVPHTWGPYNLPPSTLPTVPPLQSVLSAPNLAGLSNTPRPLQVLFSLPSMHSPLFSYKFQCVLHGLPVPICPEQASLTPLHLAGLPQFFSHVCHHTAFNYPLGHLTLLYMPVWRMRFGSHYFCIYNIEYMPYMPVTHSRCCNCLK